MDWVPDKPLTAERQDTLRQPIPYDYNNKSNEKQIKETVPTWVRTGFSATLSLQDDVHGAVPGGPVVEESPAGAGGHRLLPGRGDSTYCRSKKPVHHHCGAGALEVSC